MLILQITRFEIEITGVSPNVISFFPHFTNLLFKIILLV